jgi:hypothetical protein
MKSLLFSFSLIFVVERVKYDETMWKKIRLGG